MCDERCSDVGAVHSWMMSARWSALELQKEAIEKTTRVLCSQQEATRLQAIEDELKSQAAALKVSMTAETKQMLQTKEEEHLDAVKQHQSAAHDRIRSMQASHADEIAHVQQLMETKLSEVKTEISKLKEVHTGEMMAKTQEHKEEMIRLNHLLEAKRSEMDAEVAALKKQSDEIESTLRKEIVEENVRLNQAIQLTNDEHAKLQRDWRKKQLDKEREHTTQIEALERQKLEVEEEMHDKIKEKEREAERKIEQLREDFNTREEEFRKRGYAREKEFVAKQEASRAEYLEVQEEMQHELHKKDEELRKQLLVKEQEFQKQLENMLQGKITSQVQDLQRNLKERDMSMEVLHREATLTQQCLTQQQSVVDALTKESRTVKEQNEELSMRMVEAQNQLQEANATRLHLKQQVDAASSEEDSLKRRAARLEESLAHKDKELVLLAKEKDELLSDLGLASQTLLKRGDDFSESIRLLQRRLESSDFEAKVLHEKLQEAHVTNTGLGAQLAQATATLQQHKTRTVQAQQEADNSKCAVLQEKLMLAEGELHRRQQQHTIEIEQERSAVRQTMADLNALKLQHQQHPQGRAGAPLEASSHSGWVMATDEMQALQQRISELESYVQEVQPRIDSTQRENDTLTAEMDKVLAENAMLRNELDDLHENMEKSQPHMLAGHMLAGHTPNMRATQQQVGMYNQSYSAPGYNPGALKGHIGQMGDGRRTSGVHGMRLLRDVFGAWYNFTIDMRGAGRSASFSCLNYYCDNEGNLSPLIPVGRIRKSELNVRSEKIGSGTFADVYRGDLRIPCAMKKMKGPMQQKEIIEFVREGEMMRKVNHPSICKLLGISTDQNQYTLVFEYVAGTNLFDYLHKLHKTIPIGKQVDCFPTCGLGFQAGLAWCAKPFSLVLSLHFWHPAFTDPITASTCGDLICTCHSSAYLFRCAMRWPTCTTAISFTAISSLRT